MRRSISADSDSPPQSPVYPTTPPALELPHMHTEPHPASPSSNSKLPLRELSSSQPLTRPASFPSPPTGHDLMLMFPPPPPSLKDVDIVAGVDRPFAEHQNRLSAFQDEVRARLLGGTYVNTSTWFGKEERAYFSAADKDKDRASARESPDSEPPPKRRKSLDDDAAAYPYPRPTTLRLSPAHSPPPPPSPRPSPPQTQTPHIPPPTFPTLPPQRSGGAPRRRAGKYTRRVFVHPEEAPAIVKWARA